MNGVTRTGILIEDGVVVQIMRIDGAQPGPTLALIAGVHGDEPEGPLALKILLNSLNPRQLRGRIFLVPVSNPPAFAAGTRSSPLDGANLARVFPGRPLGGPSERTAHAITENVIAVADLLIDVHSGGKDYEMPFFVGFVASQGKVGRLSETAAFAFGAPLVWRHDSSGPGRSLGAAFERRVPAFYVEAGGGGTVRGTDVDSIVDGLQRVMGSMNMLDDATAPASPRVLNGGDGDVDSSLRCRIGGLCVVRSKPGETVLKDQVLVEIVDEEGKPTEVLKSPRLSTLMMIRRNPNTVAGDVIAMLGPPLDAAH